MTSSTPAGVLLSVAIMVSAEAKYNSSNVCILQLQTCATASAVVAVLIALELQSHSALSSAFFINSAVV
jgi:hypothetical protein